MLEYSFEQLVDLDRVRSLLEAHHKITGVCSAILDLDQNILVAEGWEDICTRFYRVHSVTHARCLESNEAITYRLDELAGEWRECKCKNGLWDIAMPIVIDGKMVATFFIGQFFYDDDEVDEDFFRAQAVEFGFEKEAYLAALRRVPVFSREQIRDLLDYYRDLVQVLAESGLQKLKLMREVEERKKAEKAQKAAKDYLEKIINSISDPIFVKDRQHRLVLVNDALCALSGRSREKMLGKTDYDFFPKEQVDVFWEKDDLVFATGEENVNEEEITDARGEKRIIVTKKRLYKDPQGKEHLVGIIRDITERKQAQEQLALLTFALDRVQEAVYLVDFDGRFLYVNDEACRGLGYSREELLDLTVPAIDPDYSIEQHVKLWPQLQERGSLTFEVSHKRKDGKRFPAEVSASYFEYAGTGYVLALVRNITERKQAEEMLRESETRMRLTLEASQIGIFDWDVANDRWLASPTYYTMLGYEAESGPGDRNEWLERVHPDERDEVGGKVQAVLALVNTHYEYEARLRHADGSYRWQHVRGFNIGHDELGRTTRILGVRTDITERKLAEQQLRQAERKLRTLVDNIPDCIARFDCDGRHLFVNPAVVKTFGAPVEHFIGKTLREIGKPGVETQNLELEAAIQQVFNEGVANGVEARWMTPKGERIFNILHVPECDESGEVVSVLGIARDITEAKQAEEALQESEQRYREVFENVSDVLYLLEVTEEGRFRTIEVNPALERFTGLSRGEMIGRYLEETMPGEIKRVLFPLYRCCVEAGTVIDEEVDVDIYSERRCSQDTYIPIRNDSGRIYRIACISRDITDRKRMEELLRKQIELETRLAKLAEVSPGAMCSFHMRADGTAFLPYVSPRFEELTGLSGAELNSDAAAILSRVHPDDKEAHLKSIAESARTLRPWQDEFRIQHPTRGWVWLEGHSAPERQDDGSIIWYGFLHDITGRKRRQTQEEVRLRLFEGLAQGRELKEILKLVVEYVELVNPDFIGNIMLADEVGRYLRPVCSLGLPKEYLAAVKKVRVGEGIGSCGAAAWGGETVIASDLRTHPFWAKYNQPALQAGLMSCWSEPIFGALGTVLGTISVYRRQPGGPNNMELELVRHACHLAAVAIERKRSLELLHQREQEFRTLVENSPNIILRYDRDCRRVYVNPAYERETGIPAGEVLHCTPDQGWLGSIPPEEYSAKLCQVMDTGEPAQILLEWTHLDDGRLTSHAFHVVPERDLSGKVSGALAIGHNITALKEAELRLAKLADSLPGCLYTYCRRPDGSACLPYASPRIQDIFGVAADVVMDDAKELFSRISPKDLASVRASMAESAHRLTTWLHEFRVRHPQKGELWVEGHAIPKAQPDGSILWHGFLNDITEQKKLEQELFKAKKLEIIGQLAGGVAHEVRNPLNALLSISEALFREKDIAENPEYEPYIQHIRTQVGRLSKLMSDLLDLGKPVKPENIQPVLLYEVLTDTISLWNTTDLGRNCRLEFTCVQQTQELLVTADATRLQQALFNLLENAAQHSVENAPICLHIEAPVEHRITILIRDAGKGIPPARLDKVFDHFYTTRTGGTGLGLSLVKHIVESMGGSVKLFNNEPLPGCTAVLELQIERRTKERA